MSSLLSLDLWPKPLRGKVVVKFVPMQLKGFPLLWWGSSDWTRCSTVSSLLWQRANAWKISFETLCSGQFMLSTQFRILFYPVILSHVEYTPFIYVCSHGQLCSAFAILGCTLCHALWIFHNLSGSVVPTFDCILGFTDLLLRHCYRSHHPPSFLFSRCIASELLVCWKFFSGMKGLGECLAQVL